MPLGGRVRPMREKKIRASSDKSREDLNDMYVQLANVLRGASSASGKKKIKTDKEARKDELYRKISDLGMDTIVKFDKYLQASIEFGIENFDDALEYAMQYSRGKERPLIEKFVKMYVNPVTVNMGDPGEQAIRKLFEMAKEKGLVPDFEISIATK